MFHLALPAAIVHKVAPPTHGRTPRLQAICTIVVPEFYFNPLSCQGIACGVRNRLFTGDPFHFSYGLFRVLQFDGRQPLHEMMLVNEGVDLFMRTGAVHLLRGCWGVGFVEFGFVEAA